MIKIQALHIEQFRGIRNFQLPLDGENLVVQGPNGSGKSGIIDAIEFALTGNIIRLSGVGTGAVSIRNHAPHVDCKDFPEKAKVTLHLSLPSGLIFSLERTVAVPSKPILNPDSKETRAALNFVVSHPEFSLSRREILKFVLTEAGKRAKEVQALLRLEAIDKSRAAFQTVLNSVSRESKTASITLNQAKTNLLTHLKISDFTKSAILSAINERRVLLGLETFGILTADIKFSDGITSDSKDPKKTIPRANSIDRSAKVIAFLDGSDIKESAQIKNGLEAIQKLKAQPALMSNLSRQILFENGLSLISDDLCPLCDLEWEQAELLLFLKEKIEKNKEAAQIKALIEAAIDERLEAFRSLSNEFEQFSKYALALAFESESKKLFECRDSLRNFEKTLARPIEKIQSSEIVLSAPLTCIAEEALTTFQALKIELEKLPDLSAEEAAKQYLFLADEKLEFYRKTKMEHDLLKKRETMASSFLNNFIEISENKLATLYSEVQNDFARFYSSLNKDDENSFSASLKPQEGALNFEVDFYGRGQFPPNAYHSEGHQDSMGLCLYLALTKKLINTSFSLCLLDDVLMSVDSGHRREVCKLLRNEFPNTQFIITTHDDVWSKQLNIEGIVKNILQFRKWTVDNGPATWNFLENWNDIKSDIEENNISSASQKLRRYLEFIMRELTFKLRAKIEAKPTDNHDLGELMSAVESRFKEHLKKANSAANSWNQKDLIKKVALLGENFNTRYKATNAEQWAVNATVHYNDWANLSPEDFNVVLQSFRDLVESLKCSTCESWFYVSPIKGTPEILRCDCGQTSFNLRIKTTN